MTWLDELKGGDEVIVVHGSYATHDKDIGKVLRTTKTKVVLESGKAYNRKNGLISPHRYNYFIEEATPEFVQRVREARHEYDLQRRVSRFFDDEKRLEGLSISQLERIAAIINEEQPDASK